MILKRVSILVSIFLFAQISMAQNVDQVIIDLISAMAENQELGEDFDFNAIYEQFERIKEDPINLNTASKEALLEIPFISEYQAVQLLEHRDRLGAINNYYELQTIPGFDLHTIKLMRELTYTKTSIGQVRSEIKASRDIKHVVFLKWKSLLQEPKGYKKQDSSGYLGSRDHLYLRYRLHINEKFQAGFIAEKDAGEPFYYKDKIYGADYYSFHIAGKNLSKHIKFLSIGDFSASFGQGLIMHSGFGGGKSAITTNIRKGGYPLRAYSSVSEFNFLRGVGLRYEFFKNLESTFVVSYKNREASLKIKDELDPFSDSYTTSLPTSGYHRTHSEIRKKDEATQLTMGGQIKLKNRRGHFAVNGLYDRLSVELIKNLQLYQYFGIESNQLWNVSTDYGYIYRNFNFFGEVAYSSNNGLATMNGLMISVDRTFDMTLAFRDYSKKYISLNANAFGESVGANNEKGIYLGLEMRPSYQWIINAYADFWKHEWLKFRIDAPSSGEEYFLRIKYFKKRKWEIYTQYFYERKARNYDYNALTEVHPVTKQRFRVHGAFKINKEWELRNRMELSFFNGYNDTGKGFLVYQDILYKPIGKNLSFTGRYGFFDINDYDARIYAYENDIINEYYIPAYNGQGFRFYLNTRYRINRHLRIEARYDIYAYTQLKGQPISDSNTIGSGNDKINGSNKSQIKIQLRYKW